MSFLREQDPRFTSLERRVGLFVLFALTALAAAVFFVAARQGLFRARTSIVFHDPSGSGLKEGMAVNISGFTVGQVTSLTLDDEGEVEAVLSIDDSYMKWVRADSVARLAKEMLIGDSRIDISPGSPGERVLGAGESIPFERPPELGELAKKVMDEVTPVLLQIKTFVEYVDDPGGDLKMTMANVNRLTAELSGTRERIDGLADDVRREIVPRVGGLLDEGRSTAGEAAETADALGDFVVEDLRDLLERLEGGAVADLRVLAARTGDTAAAAEEAIRSLEEEIGGLIGRAEELIESVRRVSDNLGAATVKAPEIAEDGGELIEDSRSLVRRTRELWPFREAPSRSAGETIDVDSYQRVE